MIFFNIKNVFLLITTLLLSSCGDTTNITNVYVINSSNEGNMTGQEHNLSNENNATGEENNVSNKDNSSQEVKNSLKGIALYGANLKQINGSRCYDIESFDGITSSLTPFYFDFE